MNIWVQGATIGGVVVSSLVLVRGLSIPRKHSHNMTKHAI
jgi:hypothetical protein